MRPDPYRHELHEKPALDWEERRSRLRVVESAAREEEALLLTRPIASPEWIWLWWITLTPIVGWLLVWGAPYLIGQAFGWLSVFFKP